MAVMTLPKVGKSAGPATLRRWRKQTGEIVSKGDFLLEVETEEGLAEVESVCGGQITRILVQAGQTVPAGTPLLELTDGPAAQGNSKRHEEVKVPSASEKNSGAVIPILMPQAGQSMEEGTLVKWHVKPGDLVKKGQIIFEIETDKATMDVEATDEGRLARIVVNDGGLSRVLEPVAYLAEHDADVDAFIAAHPPNDGSQLQSAPPQTETQDRVASRARVDETGRVKASPAARKMATEQRFDLSRVASGSGPGGRVLSTDVVKAAQSVAAKAAPPRGASPGTVQAITAEGVTRKRMSQMRKVIARNLLASKQTIPHFYLKQRIDAGALYAFYQGEKAKYPLSLNDVIVAACAKAVMEFPAFRGRIDGEEIITLPSANIGIAVGMDDGLVVPVVMAAEQKTLAQVGQETRRIAANARGGKIDGMGSGVFTITNLGMFGTEEFAGIINPPEAAILAVGAVREEVLVSGGTLRAGRVMTLTLSADHRIIDGMLAAKFMARLKEILEYPQQLA